MEDLDETSLCDSGMYTHACVCMHSFILCLYRLFCLLPLSSCESACGGGGGGESILGAHWHAPCLVTFIKEKAQ